MESTPLKPLIFLLLTLLFHHLPPSSATTLPTEALPTKSGYLTVNSTTKSAIFYTFYEAQNPTNTSLSETPLVIWLQGGPGCSSMTGNFYELGPFRVTPSLTHNVEHLVLEPNPGPWNRIFGLLFLDNPIGTGFCWGISVFRTIREACNHSQIKLFRWFTRII
ncbi:putative carboxypeptidase C [Helianthus annuus]|nr:putative carboxypeptidase C [Helianthus annuus]